jgi:hypothetical protein
MPTITTKDGTQIYYACFPYFAAKGGAVSLQFRLAGGENGILSG